MGEVMCVLVWANPGCAGDVHAYEDDVLEIAADYGATIQRRLRSAGEEPDVPVEVQLIGWRRPTAIQDFLKDPRRAALAARRDTCVASTQVFWCREGG